MEKAIKEFRLARFIKMERPICPKYVAMKPIEKQMRAYSSSNKPNTTKDVVAVKLVNRIMQADDADATAGWTPMASISGPLTMPPPKQCEISQKEA